MFCLRTITIPAVCALMLVQVQLMIAQPPGKQGTPLFNGKNFSGWYKYSADKKVNAEDLIVMDPFEKHIVIKGTGPGYLVTDTRYSNYELKFDWRWALNKENEKEDAAKPRARKSGILFHIAGDGDLIWPKSIQADLQFERAGNMYLINGFKLIVNPERQDRENSRHFLRSHDGLERQLGEWNQGVITCHGKFVSIKVNDTMVMAGRNAEFSSGRIALQSEAGEVHFRNITLRPLEGKPVDPEKDD